MMHGQKNIKLSTGQLKFAKHILHHKQFIWHSVSDFRHHESMKRKNT